MRAAAELAIAAAVFGVYRAGRLVTNDSVASATRNAEWVLDAQRWLVGAFELNVQRWTLDVPGAIELLNHFYVFVHFPATVVFLVWMFARHREWYPAIRNWFVGVTMAAMVIHVAFPLAPPRMLDGYVDTLREFGPSIYPEDPSRSLANQFAAMPSLHFGWALMVAVGIILVSTGPRRWWWLAHPAVTLLAIVATANHYLLDAAVAAALAWVIGLVVFRGISPGSPEPVAAIVGPTTRPSSHPVSARRCVDRRSPTRSPRNPAYPVPSPARGTPGIPNGEDDVLEHVP